MCVCGGVFFYKRGREKKDDKSDVHLPQPPKKSSYLLLFSIDFVLSRFWECRNKGSKKHEKLKKKFIWAHHKECGFGSLDFFVPPRLFCSIFYITFWAFRNKGVQKRDKKSRKMFCSRRKKYSLTYVTSPPPSYALPCFFKAGATRCSLRGVSAMGTPLVQLSHPVRLRGAGSGAA
jgi:hypothetical protein